MTATLASEAARAIRNLDSADILAAMDSKGYWVSSSIMDADTCEQLSRLYAADQEIFRATINMARYGFGRGEYKYFAAPIPDIVGGLREALYEQLAPVANEWVHRRGLTEEWPADLETLRSRCVAAGQARPTPLMLRYGAGDFNCLHQDLYGAIHFPLQGILLLDRPGSDFDGGELLLVENRPRKQSKGVVVPIAYGAIAVIPVKERPIRSPRGISLLQVRHGVSPLRRGQRTTLGLIFHDAT
jgi:uncharacterized protein